MEKINLNSLYLEEIEAFLKELGEPKFRSKQIFDWLHAKQVSSFLDMTNLSKSLREKLEEGATLDPVTIVKTLISKEDGTRKYLFGMSDGAIIESVLMKYEHGNTVCISTQVGCRMGCKFCASTIDGVERNLRAGEMLSQIYEIQKESGERVHGVVLMGSGEPLDNYEEVIRFIRLINSPLGQNMGQRHITLSTCGLIPKINQLAEEDLQITLAVSLHAPNDEVRRKTMPVANANPMEDLLDACRAYIKKTNRRITFEYALIQGVNDSEAYARELAGRLRHMLCHINLIPVNDVKERDYVKSSNENVKKFAAVLQNNGIETTVRRKLGSDIEAACGQLRRSHMHTK